MDPQFSALFGQIQTKTVHRVLSPIANRVSQLVLFHEAHEVSIIQGDDHESNGAKSTDAGHRIVSADLPGFTRDINAALRGLTSAAMEGRDAHDNDEGDVVERKAEDDDAMATACCDLLAAGESLASAATTVSLSAELQPGNRGVSTQSHARVERARLVDAAKHVLRQTLNVLLIADRQEVQRLLRVFGRATEAFSQLVDSRSLKELVPRFKSFTDLLLEVSDAVEMRGRELTSAKRSEALAASLVTLQKTPHTLCGAMQTFIK